MKILGIETSSPLFSIGLSEDDRLLSEARRNREFDGQRDAHFFDEANRLVDYYGLENIGAIAVDIGPGMFTSLRVGLSLAKGFALACDIPVVSVNSLDAIGIPASSINASVLVAINAYHGEIYAASYTAGRRDSDYLLTVAEEVAKMVGDQTVVIGSGVELFRGLHHRLRLVMGGLFIPTASSIIRLASKRIFSGEFDEPDLLEPYYIKKTDAERNLNKTDVL